MFLHLKLITTFDIHILDVCGATLDRNCADREIIHTDDGNSDETENVNNVQNIGKIHVII